MARVVWPIRVSDIVFLANKRAPVEIKCESYKSVKRRTVKDNEVSQVMLSQSFAGVCTLQCGASLQENKTMYFRLRPHN